VRWLEACWEVGLSVSNSRKLTSLTLQQCAAIWPCEVLPYHIKPQ
jgi:hypothetical protein